MQSTVGILLALVSFITGHIMQIDIRINPEKYNLRSLDTSSLPTPVDAPEFDGFIQLNEVNMHYNVYGHGKQPLILIHGNGGTVKSLSEAARYLANDYTVYVTESRCHGQSSDPGVISYELMAKDTVEFAAALGIEKPIVMGHSDGAITALCIAADYPDFPAAIISCGANSKPSAFWPYFTAGVKLDNIFRNDKLNDMMLTQPDFTAEYLAKITCPTYIVCGEYDIMMLSDTLFLHNSIKGSDLIVIKGANHGSYISRNGKKAYALATQWLPTKGL